jgi:hypothetical protein
MRARGHGLFALVALVAVFLQSFVVQTHIDGLAGLVPVVSVERGVSAPPPIAKADPASHDTQAPCPICQALATAGTTLLASGPALVSALGIIAHEARIDIRRVPVRPAHAWQSRAPPLSL